MGREGAYVGCFRIFIAGESVTAPNKDNCGGDGNGGENGRTRHDNDERDEQVDRPDGLQMN